MTLLSHYWRDDDPAELTGAIGQDWADALEGLPQEFIQRACVAYLRDEPRRKPTPGAIYQLARSFMPKPAPARIDHFPKPDPDHQRISKERAAEIMKEVGFRPRKFGGGND